MKKSRVVGTIYVCFLYFSTTSANAALIERTATLDLLGLGLPSSNIWELVTFNPVSLDQGDIFTFHLDFINGPLTVTDVDGGSNEYMGWSFLSTPPGGTGFLFDTTFHFKGVSGNLLQNDFTISFGGPFAGNTGYTNLTDDEFSFTGVTLTVDIWYKEPGRPAFNTSEVRYNAQFNNGDVVFSSPIPLPPALWLFGSGLLGLVGVSRKKAS